MVQNINNMKANQHKGNARKGAKRADYTIAIKKAAHYCGEKTTALRTRERTFNKKNKPTFGSVYWNSVLNSPNYEAYMNKFHKRDKSLVD